MAIPPKKTTAVKKPVPVKKPVTPAKAPALSQATLTDLAANYGFALSFLNSDPELKKLFGDAIGNGWNTTQFIARLRNTSWYRTNSESARQYQVLQGSDPATLAQRKEQYMMQISQDSAALGAVIPWTTIGQIADTALKFNYNQAQLRNIMGGYVQAVNGIYNGQAGVDAGTLHSTAWRNGINVSSSSVQSWVQQIAQGKATANFFQDYIRKMAKSLAPGYSDELDAGMDLYDIASPYMQDMARLLELNPQQIDLFDPTIRGVLSKTNADGKAEQVPLWQFEQQLRKDPRWLVTDNARSAGMNVAHQVLKDFGFSY